jgi:hypothetical protein
MLPPSLRAIMSWIENEQFHDSLVQEVIDRYGGVSFARAPFDVIDTEGRFIEVKKMKTKKNGSHQIHLSKEQILFGSQKNMFLYLAWGNERSLLPLGSNLKRRLANIKMSAQQRPNLLRRFKELSISKRLLTEHRITVP